MSGPITERQAHFVDGRWWTPAIATSAIPVSNAADGSVLGSIPYGSIADADAAVAAARAAFDGWSQTPPWTRANYLKGIRDYLSEYQNDIAELIALEVGTPIRLAQRIQAGLPLETLDGFVEVAQQMDWTEMIGHSTIRHAPVGLVSAITPWNYPLHQLVGKVGGALAAGCTVVAKPAEVAPLSAFYLAEACAAAGLPAGVFNLITGPGVEIGERLVTHPQVDMVSFTGSTAVGARIAELAARNITRVALELGGKSASVLLDDADFDRAVRSSVGNCFLNSGQTCSAWTRLVVPRARMAQVVASAIEAAMALKVGHPLDADSRLGPLASAAHRDAVEAAIATAESRGDGTIAWRGDRPAGEGYYVAPVIFTDVDPASPLAQKEIFGPVLAIMPHDGDEDAIAIANNSAYGLAGAVWSRDEERALRVATRIRAGQIDINGAPFNPRAPFGGFGKSGYGREFGLHGIHDFLELQSIQGRAR